MMKRFLILAFLVCAKALWDHQRVKRLLILFFICCAPAFADCQSAGNQTIGGSVVCVQAASATGTTTNVSSNAVNISPTAGHQLVMWGYMCTTNNCTQSSDWASSHTYPTYAGSGQETTAKIFPTVGNPCNFTFAATTGGQSSAPGNEPTWSSPPCGLSSPTVTDNTVTWKAVTLIASFLGASPACVTSSSSSPAPLQNHNAYLNWSWYCPSVPSGMTQFDTACSVTSACSFISLFIEDYTGMCSTAPCYDTDGFGNAASSTSQTVSVSPATSYTNELVTYIGGTINDEALTAGGGCAQVDQQWTGNQIAAKYAAVNGPQSCSMSWTGLDTSGMLIVAIKSAASVLGTSPISKIRKQEKLDPQ